jgi:hypothetical protein
MAAVLALALAPEVSIPQAGDNTDRGVENAEEPVPVRGLQPLQAHALKAAHALAQDLARRRRLAARGDALIDTAVDPYTGEAIELVMLASGRREIRRRTAAAEERLAVVTRRDDSSPTFWSIAFDNGEQTAASAIALTARGFLAAIPGRLLSYASGGRSFTVAWPAGFHPAAVQSGSVRQTGYLLLERDRAPGQGAAARLIGLKTALMAALGRTPQDYLLVDLHGKHSYPLDIASRGIPAKPSGYCADAIPLPGLCAGSSEGEGLFTSLGADAEDVVHSVYWFRSAHGAYLAALEDGRSKLTVTRLDDGEERGGKRTAFSRRLGIAGFSVEVDAEGRAAIVARLGGETRRIGDLDAAFAALPPVGEGAAAPRLTGTSGSTAAGY